LRQKLWFPRPNSGRFLHVAVFCTGMWALWEALRDTELRSCHTAQRRTTLLHPATTTGLDFAATHIRRWHIPVFACLAVNALIDGAAIVSPKCLGALAGVWITDCTAGRSCGPDARAYTPWIIAWKGIACDFGVVQ
jgi:hypothetical protein